MIVKTLWLYLFGCITRVYGDFNILFGETLKFNGLNFYAKDSKFIYGGSGCGDRNSYCWCSIGENSMVMRGQGSPVTATGLTFTCSFEIYEPTQNKKLCECSHYVDIPFSDANSDTLKCPCLKIPDYTPISSTKKVFNLNREVRLKEVPVKITYCKSHQPQLNSTSCYYASGAYNNLIHTRTVHGACPEGLSFKFNDQCYAECMPERINFQDKCIDKTSIMPIIVAENPCRVDRYQQEENTGGQCEDDCDCNGNRCCKNATCQDC